MSIEQLNEDERLILAAIEDAIIEGAHEWDAYAVPATEGPAKKAWQKIKAILESQHDGHNTLVG